MSSFNKINIPVYIISLNGKTSFDFSNYFSNVTIVPAINTLNDNPKDLYSKGVITTRVLLDLENGRKDHWAFPGKGGIGLYLTYKKIIESLQNVKENVLICEQDCIIKNIDEFARKIHLLNNFKNFDCAIFGGSYYKNVDAINEINNYKSSNSKSLYYSELDSFNENSEFINYKNIFYFLHSVVWTPRGIKKIHPLLSRPIDVQLDAFFSNLCKNEMLNLLMEKNKTTEQDIHKSTLNNDNKCYICDMKPQMNKIKTDENKGINYSFLN